MIPSPRDSGRSRESSRTNYMGLGKGFGFRVFGVSGLGFRV